MRLALLAALFAHSLANGTMPSEDAWITGTPPSHPVAHFTAQQLEASIKDKTITTVVLFCTPYSGHCKKFAKTYDALAKAHQVNTKEYHENA